MNQRFTIAFTAFATSIAIVFSLQAQNPPKPPTASLKNAIGMEFVRVAPGEFTMGCSPGDAQCNADENPRHRVQIARRFELGKYEVTQAQWVALMQSNPSGGKGDNRPVENVSKTDAEEFVAKLNARGDGFRYRLPTEAEWEYSARAGMNSVPGALGEFAWYADNSSDETHPVGQKKPNAWGLYDMQGNVREWVSDFYSATYYDISPVTDPTGPQPCGPGAAGSGPGGRGIPNGPPGGRGGPGGPRGGNNQPGFPPPPPPPPPPALPPGASQQEQIDALRRQVDQLQRQLQQLRDDFQAGPPRGGPGGPGGPNGGVSGPFQCVGQGTTDQGPVQLVDTLDGLPTGLPVVRGGGWDQSDRFLRVSARYSYYGPTLRISDIGFRVAREPLGQTQ